MKQFYFALAFTAGMFSGNVVAQEATKIFHYKVGEYEVYTLNETEGQGNRGILLNTTPEMITETLSDGKFPNAVNAFLIKTPENKNILVDAGYGTRLVANLNVAGVGPEAIQTVLLTHMHGDHIGGLLKEDKVVFPNARLHIAAPEYNYWTSDEEKNKLPENKQRGFIGAQKVVGLYEVELLDPETIQDAVEREQDGIYTIAAYGHTPGHVGYLLVSNEQKLFIWGDLTHAMAIQMPYPGVATTYDVDPETAVIYREQLLRYLADQNIPVAGMHVPFPAIGELQSTGNNSYQYISED